MQSWLEDFKQTIEAATPRLMQISEAQSEAPRAEAEWSSKQILGHLIDSAANNHARFVLAQTKDDLVFAGYDQDQWVQLQNYQGAAWSQLIELWRAYNLHLCHVMSAAAVDKMNAPRARHSLPQIAFHAVAEDKPATLEYLMKDYVDHLKHHLSQIFSGAASEIISKPATRERRARIGVLISGRGSNMLALADAIRSETIPDAEIAIVVSDQAAAEGLARASERGIKTVVIERRGRLREEHDREIVATLKEHQIDLVCLAGYMRILSHEFLAAFPHRILNIHPSLLPLFPGLHPQQQALDHGAQESGCTVHLVDGALDGGPVIAQRQVPVLPGDTAETLAARILIEEHKLYPEAVKKVLLGDNLD
jgi:phosphoribosylglycinamide formyltransferase-1